MVYKMIKDKIMLLEFYHHNIGSIKCNEFRDKTLCSGLQGPLCKVSRKDFSLFHYCIAFEVIIYLL